MNNHVRRAPVTFTLPVNMEQGYDPELLFVECGRCGAPVLWEKGQATQVLASAGVDPLELDSSCLLISDGCPACCTEKQYSVQIFRVETTEGRHRSRLQAGHA